VKGLTKRDVVGYGLFVLGITVGMSALIGLKTALIVLLPTIAIFGAAWAVKSVLSKDGTTIE